MELSNAKCRRRPPRRLGDIAFHAWLKALEGGVTLPEASPSRFLLEALSYKNKMTESTIIRVVQALASTGVRELEIEPEIVNPTMLHQLASASLANASELQKVRFCLSPRLNKNSSLLLVEPLLNMKNLRELCLIGGANDTLLKAIAKVDPPLVKLNVSNSKYVSDEGIRSLILDKDNDQSLLRCCLISVSLWDTSVTTRGCILALKNFPQLETFSSHWTFEALFILSLKELNATKLSTLSIREGNDVTQERFDAIKMFCPLMKKLVIHRSTRTEISLRYVLDELSHLEELTVIELMPLLTQVDSTAFQIYPNLTYLSLCSYYDASIDLGLLRTATPSLRFLSIEGALKPELSNVENLLPFQDLISLRLNSSLCQSWLNPVIAVQILQKLTPYLTRLELGHCNNFMLSDYESLFCSQTSLLNVMVIY